MAEERAITEAEGMEVANLTPSPMVTFKRADGELMDGEYGWTTDLEATTDSLEYPLQVTEETWRRTTFRTFWLLPEVYGSCEFPMPAEDDADALCEEDATGWRRDPDTGKWYLVCAWHDGEVLACQG